MVRSQVSWLSPIIFGLLLGHAVAQDTWCGKVYNGSAQIIPGGFLTASEPSSSPLLDVQVIPRHSIYVGNETTAEFIVDAVLSSYHGSAYSGLGTSTGANASDTLAFTVASQGNVLVSGNVDVGTSDNLFSFNLSQLTPSTTSYPITLTGSTSNGGNFTAASELFYLPNKDTGSVVKVDRLYGSILYRNNNTAGVFKAYFPYGYYGSYGGYFNVTGVPTQFANDGFNALNIVSDFADGDMTYTLDEMDGTDLMLQYDMRNSYQNLTSVTQQLPLVKDHPSLLTYYTADEPDGWGYTFDSCTDAYNLLATQDKYHPTALVLNCQNYYFEQYSAGADIIMEDAYPVGINATFSTKWNTPVNLTYGDCGCDNCVGSFNLLNVATRVDDFKKYAAWLGGSALTRKPIWAVPQAFSGEQYWSRDPTAEETWATDLLAFNHGAKGRLAWLYPPSAVLGNASAQLAKVVTVSPVVDYLTGANPVLVQDATTASGNSSLDVAYWSPSGQGVLVGVVNPVDSPAAAPVKIALPGGLNVSKIGATPWGNTSWSFDGSALVATGGLAGHATSYILLE
ncbi:hypothetical protein N0V82_009863 [Gnomoniopsis sp. IMI 355080]|nr:hypothetical protein N0V82_009863 [Gnomoniopsis sp. IMI 355080]